MLLLSRDHGRGEAFRVLQGLQCSYSGDVSGVLHLLTEVIQTKPKGLGWRIIMKWSRCHQKEQLWMWHPAGVWNSIHKKPWGCLKCWRGGPCKGRTHTTTQPRNGGTIPAGTWREKIWDQMEFADVGTRRFYLPRHKMRNLHFTHDPGQERRILAVLCKHKGKPAHITWMWWSMEEKQGRNKIQVVHSEVSMKEKEAALKFLGNHQKSI